NSRTLVVSTGPPLAFLMENVLDESSFSEENGGETTGRTFIANCNPGTSFPVPAFPVGAPHTGGGGGGGGGGCRCDHHQRTVHANRIAASNAANHFFQSQAPMRPPSG